MLVNSHLSRIHTFRPQLTPMVSDMGDHKPNPEPVNGLFDFLLFANCYYGWRKADLSKGIILRDKHMWSR